MGINSRAAITGRIVLTAFCLIVGLPLIVLGFNLLEEGNAPGASIVALMGLIVLIPGLGLTGFGIFGVVGLLKLSGNTPANEPDTGNIAAASQAAQIDISTAADDTPEANPFTDTDVVAEDRREVPQPRKGSSFFEAMFIFVWMLIFIPIWLGACVYGFDEDPTYSDQLPTLGVTIVAIAVFYYGKKFLQLDGAETTSDAD